MDFEAIGKTIKQTTDAYQNIPDAALGEAYAKKMYPAEYQKFTTQQSANVNAGKEIEVYKEKQKLDASAPAKADPVVASAIDNIINGRQSVLDIPADKKQEIIKGLADNKYDFKNAAKSGVQDTVYNILDRYGELGPLDKTPVLGGLLSKVNQSAGYTYKQQKAAIADKLAQLLSPGMGFGMRMNDALIKRWIDYLPNPGDNQSQVQQKLRGLNDEMLGKFGTGLDKSYLDQYGVQVDENGKAIKTNSSLGKILQPQQSQPFKIIEVK